jgi:ubiquinone/menaquinone biosynthesis C-methylase UbiE
MLGTDLLRRATGTREEEVMPEQAGATTGADARDLVAIPDEIFQQVQNGLGAFFSRLNGVPPEQLAADMLNPAKSIRNFEVLARFVEPRGKRILEIGSGYGINLIAWTKHYGLDVTGVEPESEGFVETIETSKRLCELNGVPPDRVVVSRGETLPFPDASFDVVYSANVLEHTRDAKQVLREALRVLKPGGILHFEMPNFTSFFEGHYLTIMPPLLHRAILPWWVRVVRRRDPAFARTMRTEINPVWLRRTIRSLGKEEPLRLVSLGEEVFRERLAAPSFQFQHSAVASILSPAIQLLRNAKISRLIGNLLVGLQAHYPIYLTVAKERA